MSAAVVGQCPMGCGETLFLGNGGYVTCRVIGCPDPAAASRLLKIAPRAKSALDEMARWARVIEEASA